MNCVFSGRRHNKTLEPRRSSALSCYPDRTILERCSESTVSVIVVPQVTFAQLGPERLTVIPVFDDGGE